MRCYDLLRVVHLFVWKEVNSYIVFFNLFMFAVLKHTIIF